MNLGPNRLVTLGTKGGPAIRVGFKAAPSANLLVYNNVPYVIDCGYGVSFKLVEAGGAVRPLILRKRPDGMGADPERTAGLAPEAALIRLAEAAGAPVPQIVHVATAADGRATT